MPVRSVRFASRVVPSALTLAAVALVAAAAPRHPPIRGTTYTKHTVTTPTGDGPAAAAMAAVKSDFTGVVVFAAGRGRMDVVDGSNASPKLDKGDYVLFDSSDYIVVNPSAKTFYSTPANLLGNMASAMPTGAAMPSVSLKDVTTKLDTLGAGDPLGGLATQHYRETLGYTMVIDMSGMGVSMPSMPPMQSTMTMEFWYADVAPLPPDPFAGLGKTAGTLPGGMMGGTMMKDLADRQAALQAALPSGKTAVKTTTSMQISGMMSMSMTGTTEITQIKTVDVDPDRLVLPDGFTQVAMPGMEMFAGQLPADGGAKWKVRPGGG